MKTYGNRRIMNYTDDAGLGSSRGMFILTKGKNLMDQ